MRQFAIASVLPALLSIGTPARARDSVDPQPTQLVLPDFSTPPPAPPLLERQRPAGHAGGDRLALLLFDSLTNAQGWQIPPAASTEKSPVAPRLAVFRKGKALYISHCAGCHGLEGRGDGPDKTTDPAHRPADLTNASRATLNPDGVMFYKIWNGRAQPTMPAFKTRLSRNDVWAIVEYVKTLRKSGGERSAGQHHSGASSRIC
jgi:mono/diheme cytochrome c family protein